MRTHIRMHFDKKSSDFNEEHYISCIVEDDGLEHQVLPAPAPTASSTHTNSQTIQQLQQQQQQQETTSTTTTATAQMHNCDKCNYSSSYKGNVVSIWLDYS